MTMDINNADRHRQPSFGSSMNKDARSARKRIEALERVMEGLFTLPGTNRKVGLDVMLNLVPVAGTTAAAAIGTYLAWEARNLGMRKRHVARMAGNIGVDWLLGLIPFVGAVPDFFFRSNTRNLRIIKRHLDKHHPNTATIDVAPVRRI